MDEPLHVVDVLLERLYRKYSNTTRYQNVSVMGDNTHGNQQGIGWKTFWEFMEAGDKKILILDDEGSISIIGLIDSSTKPEIVLVGKL